MTSTHRELEDLKEKTGILTFEKSPKYLLEILFNNSDEKRNYEVKITIVKPFGKLLPGEKIFEFPFCQEGRAQAYLKFVEERNGIDRQRNGLV